MESLPLPAPALQSIVAPTDSDAEVLVVALSEDGSLPGPLAQLNRGDHWIDRLMSRGQLRGKKGELSLIAFPSGLKPEPNGLKPVPSGSMPEMILAVGIGRAEKQSPNLAFDSAATAIRRLTDRPRKSVLISLAESFPEEMHESLVAGCIYGCEGQGIYQSEVAIHVPEKIVFSGVSQAAIDRGRVLGESINQTRRLVNEPPAMIYPESFARRAAELASDVGLSVEIWDESRLATEGCRAMLAVGAGSAKKPRLVILRHDGGNDEPPIALVGKGVTFDSGGLSLKPSESMADMKCDMAGAATVVGVMTALARLGVKRNVIGFCGLAENMVSGESYKLGDVIETRSGKTIEILNTDAEGRVVLADTLDVAVQHRPSAMVDLATLTGACMVALGTEVAGLMTNDQPLCDQLRIAAEQIGEPVWQLPMFELYDEKVKSCVADIKNVGEGRWGGAITAAKFLQHFVGDVPWVHIDIAGPAFADSAKPHRDAGATGVMVRTLVRWIEASSQQ